MRVAINGFGRIGRHALRIGLERNLLDIVAINDLSGTKIASHLLKYDSIYNVWPHDVSAPDEKTLICDGKKIAVVSERDPEKIPWGAMGVDLIIDCTGAFCDREGASKHLKAGAKKVLISAPAKNVDRTIVIGINENEYDPQTDHLISNASCTTNCLAPVAKVLNDQFGIVRGIMTTIHAYTNDQNIHDLAHKDMRRARAATLNMIPTTTGAAKAIGEVIPSLKGKMTGFAVRVPVPTVSAVDLTCDLAKEATADEINQAFRDASANGQLKGILDVCDLPLVSSDFKSSVFSAIIDAQSTTVIDGKMVKILAWYDNEWTYSLRLVELANMIASR